MDSTHDQELPGDLSALAWVQDELRRTLDNAHKSLRRQLRNQELQPAEVPAPASHPALQQARNLIHQGVGALELIGQVSAARVLRASEQVVQRIDRGELVCEAGPVEAIEKASFAVLDFLGRQLAGRAPSELGLFPQYREVMTLAGAERIHPSDLWEAIPVLPAAAPSAATAPDPRVRQAVEARLLKYLRGDVAAARRMSDAFAQLGERTEGRLGLAWRLASGFFEAQAQGLLPPDLLAKRLASRLLVQLRAVERGAQDCPDRLLQDLLFFCARARRDDAQAPRLSQVARQCALPALDGADYEHSPLGRYDPALVPQARRRVAALKESWSLVASGELASLASLHEQTAQVGESIRHIYQDGERLAQALQTATESAVQAGRGPSPELAMEVATTLLCLDASLDEADPEHPDLQDRIQQVAQRLEVVTAGGSAPPLEPWVETLYRDVSDRQSMGSVVQELRATLAEIEQQLDRFNRNTDERDALTPVPNQFNAMRGVLSVLGLDQAAQAVQRMRDDVAAVLAQDADASRATEQLADNLGALSFLIDMLGVQPQLAKALFRFDPSTGRFAALMGRAKSAAKPVDVEPALMDQVQTLARSAEQEGVSTEDLHRHLEGLADQAVAADQSDVAQVVSQAREALAQAQDAQAEEAARADVVQALSALATPPAPPATLPVSAPAGDDDDDMREIFLEEAREVLEQAREGLAGLRADASDLEAMTTVRRAFHTLKGSSRMVGLMAFGEAAWSCEQLYNARLAEAVVRADEPLCDFTGRALDQLEDWVGRIAEGQDDAPQGAALMAEAQALRLGAQGAAVAAAPAQEEPSAVPAVEMPEVSEVVDPSAAWAAATMPLPILDEALTEPASPTPEVDPHLIDLDLDLDAGTGPAMAMPDLDLDLSFDAPEPPQAPGEAPDRLSLLELPSDLRDVVATGEVENEPPTTIEPSPDLTGGLPPSWSDTQMDEAPELAAMPPAPPREEPVLLEAWVSEELHERVNGLQEEGAPSEPGMLPETPAEVSSGLSAPEAGPTEPVWAETAAGAMPTPEVEPSEQVEPSVQRSELPAGPAEAAAPPEDDAERYKVVGPLRIQIALFNIYLNEADEQSRRLSTELSEWQLELDRPVGETAVALAHSLAGNSATVGFQDLSSLARRLEHALERSHARGRGEAVEATLYLAVAEEIRRLLHQFAAGFLKPVQAEILEQLSSHEHDEVQLIERLAALEETAQSDGEERGEADEDADRPVTSFAALNPLGEMRFSALEHAEPSPTAAAAPVRAEPAGAATLLGEQIEASDAIDAELFDIFVEEGAELLPQLAEHLRLWEAQPDQMNAGVAAMRALHTFKGGARLAGAMRLGEMAHRLETAIERHMARGQVETGAISQLYQGVDQLAEEFARLQAGGFESLPEPVEAPVAPPELEPVATESLAQALSSEPELDEISPVPVSDEGAASATPAVRVDWSRLAKGFAVAGHAPADLGTAAELAAGSVRVRAPLLDRMVSHAGEVGIARARMEADVGQMQGSLRELTDNLERLRRQLRDLELQAETQMATRIEAARSSQQSFDPLEMDRFTRVQELTRMMAESVSDVGTVQRSLLQTLQDAEDQLAMQARLARDLQDDLLRARMVEFDTLSDRLYRVVRQAAKETGKQVRLNFSGGGIEMDRAVLDRIAPPLEHLLRNAVVHGIEPAGLREALGKPSVGGIDVVVRQSGNEVQLDVRDDGAGLNLARIAERATAAGLLTADSRPTEAELASLIFAPGFSTADEVTELAGRGVGMDVVRTEVTAMGGRIETASTSGQGTAFRMLLPLTTAVTQVVLMQAGSQTVAVPSTLVETVRRVPAAEIEQAYAQGVLRHGEEDLPFFWLGSLLQDALRGSAEGRTLPVVVVRSADQRVAIHVSQILGNQEVVVKNLGPQLSRLPGLAGMSVRASGETVLIYNPVALVAVYGADVRAQLQAATQGAGPEVLVPVVQPVEPEVKAPLVLVVDDSLTVRRVTQRLLQREGYRVALAKDGLEALERLAEETPVVMLCDIEMPRMDGFDLMRNVRGDVRLASLPVIMITSRIAEKHQEHARELGVNHYLGKPYDEDQLLKLVQGYVQARVEA
ncbi:Hpt domain-containing protein [Ideonella oryzae]|uniref:histidine kinase n=1 Tax=Ideonella oryzae TaxID=2937441 RepID=A0ABT1BLX7_9BURK|nr:Hpt domain-containing protein [Ideonella oryzae]MCO5976844.1 Hpt domain-containing protein [Ideonella oryzae]